MEESMVANYLLACGYGFLALIHIAIVFDLVR